MAGAALVVALASGCTDSSAGTPLPRDTESSESSAPARPRELRLESKDPCALVPETDWPRFNIKRPGELEQSETYESPECFYNTTGGYFRVVTVVTEGIEAWDESKRNIKRREVDPVAGFPAISVHLPTDDNACDVAVDVADGQHLLAGVGIDNRKLPEVPEVCEYAHQLAESAMSTLVAS